MSFEIIYADPAWSYDDKATAGDRGAAFKYPVMSVEDICALDVQAHTAPDCACFMWATPPCLPEAFQVMAAWGFKYSTIAFVWVKTRSVRIAEARRDAGDGDQGLALAVVAGEARPEVDAGERRHSLAGDAQAVGLAQHIGARAGGLDHGDEVGAHVAQLAGDGLVEHAASLVEEDVGGVDGDGVAVVGDIHIGHTDIVHGGIDGSKGGVYT